VQFLPKSPVKARLEISVDQARRVRIGRPPISEYTIRIGGAAGLVPFLRERGIDPVPLLHEVGLSPAVFDSPDNEVPFASLCQAVHISAQRTGLSDLGLRLCTDVGLKSLGVLGYLVANSETVARGLQTLVEYLYVHDEGAVASLVVENDEARLGYEVLAPALPGADQVTYGALAIACNLMRAVCGASFRPRHVTFAYRQSGCASYFRSFFGCPVEFDEDRSALMFDAHWLAAPVQDADRYIRAIFEAQLAHSVAGHHSVTEDRVQRVIRTLMATGRFSEEEVARAFGMSVRSLARRLNERGSTFRRVLDQARYDAARALLGDSGAAIVEIAARLGYSEQSTFARAFRRWSGTSPARWRRGKI